MTSAPTEFALDLHDVEKIYGSGKRRVEALRGVSLQVYPGEVFGLLGPNGAGKSTLVKILMTVVHPTRGSGTVLGRPIGAKSTLAHVGYLPEHHRFPRYLTGRQMLEFFGALCGVPRATRKSKSAELLETVGMSQWGDRRVDSYSKGMLQRVGLAQALMNDPHLIVLDEPTDGVDPIGRKDILAVLKRLRDQGKTVFVNSHLLGELELISDRVAIMVRGQVVRQGTIDELTANRQWYEVDITAESAAPVPELLHISDDHPAQETRKGQLADGIWLQVQTRPEGTTVRLGTADPSRIQPTLDSLRQAHCIIRRIQAVRPSLQDLFMEAVTDPATHRPTGVGGVSPDVPPLPEVRP